MGENGEKNHGELRSDHVQISPFSPLYAIGRPIAKHRCIRCYSVVHDITGFDKPIHNNAQIQEQQ